MKSGVARIKEMTKGIGCCMSCLMDKGVLQ